MTELENKSILHEIELGRVENGIVKNCLLTLEKANLQIKQELKNTKGITTKKRYNEISKYINEVSNELKTDISNEMDVDEFLDYEINAQTKLYKKYANKIFQVPNKEQLITSATFAPYSSTSTFATYLNSFSNNFFDVWDSNVRLGYLNGLTTQKIVQNVMGFSAKNSQVAEFGAIQSLRNSIVANTRTALQSFANQTRKLIYSENKDIISGYKWLATLDRKTCLVCGHLDGQERKNIDDFDKIPLHMNCRCILIPTIKGYEELETEERASENGTVKNVSFEEWLKEQDDATQKDVLGLTRYNLYKNGVKIDSFVDNGQTLTLAELRQRDILNLSGGILDKSKDIQDNFAESYYAEIRNRKSKSDIAKIAQNTGFSEDKIAEVRKHIFEEKEHLLSDGSKSIFSADVNIALAWQRLEQNKITQNDILLLNHEYVELSFMNKKGYNYEKAHYLADLRYPWEFKIKEKYKRLSDGKIYEIVRECIKDYL